MDAEQLDFPDASFDRVFCGFGIMFLADRPAAIRGFRRVLRPGGRLAVSTWRRSNAEDLQDALEQLGRGAPRQPGWITEPDQLQAVLAEGGFARVRVSVEPHTLVFASVEEYVATTRTTGARRLVDGLDAATLSALHAALAERLEAYRGAGGLHVPASALIGFADA
jgi:SAM-dependent methyltransferase